MATQLGGIPLYQPRQATPMNPLDSLIQGIQQGNALAQMPQTIQNNQLNQMLQQAILREKLLDLQDPNRAVARQLNQQLAVQAVNPASGVSYDPSTAQAASVLGPISQPGTVSVDATTGKVTQVTPRQESLQGIMAGATPSPFIFNPDIPRAAQAQAGINKALQEGAEAKARNAQKVFDPTIFTDGKTSRWITPGQDIPEGFYDPKYPPGGKASSTNKLKGFDTITGLYGTFDPDENGMYPEGVVPISQAPKKEKLKTPSTTQVDSLAGFDVLQNQIEVIKKTPQDVRSSNVGWIDSALGKIQSVTGLGTKNSVAQNEAFRNAVDTLVGEFSFGRGGKSLTVNEKAVLGKYLPALSNSNVSFEARLDSFGNLIKEMKAARLQALEDSGYDVSRFNRQTDGNTTPPPSRPVTPADIRKKFNF